MCFLAARFFKDVRARFKTLAVICTFSLLCYKRLRSTIFQAYLHLFVFAYICRGCHALLTPIPKQSHAQNRSEDRAVPFPSSLCLRNDAQLLRRFPHLSCGVTRSLLAASNPPGVSPHYSLAAFSAFVLRRLTLLGSARTTVLRRPPHPFCGPARSCCFGITSNFFVFWVLRFWRCLPHRIPKAYNREVKLCHRGASRL